MFKRKQDIDRHVLSLLNRKKDEKERNSQGYQIARLYLDIKEYETAKKYLASFLHVRDNSPQAHQMMGEINEAIGKKDLAIDNYKRALDLGGFGSSNRQLVLKICELYCDIGTDEQRMKYWLQKCEELFPQSDIVYRMKSRLASSTNNGTGDNAEIEKLLLDELLNRPTDLDLRIKLLRLYMDMGRIDEAYDAAIVTDLTMAFVEELSWYECVVEVFEKYSHHSPDSVDVDYMLMNMHVLRNATFLSLPSKNLASSIQLLQKFDEAVKQAGESETSGEAWQCILKEMNGQLLYLAGLALVKKAITGSIQWQEANQLSGACFLASRSVSPLDAQAPWFVKPRKEYAKFYNWWHLQSYDRLSQVGRTIQQLSQNDITDWSKSVHQQIMTGPGQKRVFEALYASASQDFAQRSFLYGTSLMVGRMQEPLTLRQLLDIDKVAYQVHLGKLSHLVWLCLHRYAPNMDRQPNYHFTLMENIQFSVKNIESAGSENLCQLDVLAFLLASVRCAASSISENVFSYEDQSGRPTLVPANLSRSLCTQEQEEWWTTAFKFCSNAVKDDFSRLRRVLIRGIEVIRLKGSHGVSIPMQCHLARSLDAKVKSLRSCEFGCRCTAAELTSLEARAQFYWQRALDALQKVKKNQHPPVIKNRLFKEAGDGDLPPRMVDKLMAEAEFATALSLMAKGQHEDALERFEKHNSPSALYYCAQIYRTQAYECLEGEKQEAYMSLLRQSRDGMHKALDSLQGDKSHELNFLVRKELDDIEIEIQGFDFEENETRHGRDSFYTPDKSASNMSMATNGYSHLGHNTSIPISHSTPRPPASDVTKSEISGRPEACLNQESTPSPPVSQFRPSPERLDSQIKSLSYSQTTLFKTVLDRNEELVMMHSRMMEEHRTQNNLLQTALTDNKKVMTDLKDLLVENKDLLKGIKSEIASLKSTIQQPPAAGPMAAGPPLIMANPHMPPGPPRGAYTGFPPHPNAGMPQYPGYLLNSPMPQTPAMGVGPGSFRTGGHPGARSQTGKFKGQYEEDVVDEEEDLDPNMEDFSALYPEYFKDVDSSYSQYYTPDGHMQDWSVRPSAMEPPLSISPSVQPPATRMPMPQPGFFSSALRGQSLQYAQQPTSVSTPSQPTLGAAGSMTGSGLFSPSAGASGSAPQTSSFQTPTFSFAVSMQNAITSPAGQSNVPISPAMPCIGSGNTGQPAGLKEALANGQMAGMQLGSGINPPSEDLGATLGFKVLFHIKAALPARNVKGAITILLGPNNSRTTVVMMSDSEEMLFQHDACGLTLQPPSAMPGITWTATKIGPPMALPTRETVTVTILPESMGKLFRDALQKAVLSVGGGLPSPASGSLGKGTPSMGAPLFGNVPSPASSMPVPATSAKTMLGGLSFSTPPVLTPAEKEREKASPHKGASSPVKITDNTKPFAGVTLSVPKFTSSSPSAGQSQVSPQKSPSGRRDDERVEEYEPNVDFKPLIPLPELVDKKTGEEDETELFVDRCRLYRYDKETSQWKERGIGEMKILADKDNQRFRVIMRRDQILKLCANHGIQSVMKLSPMANSDKTWCYTAMDYSDEEMKREQLAVRFKNPEKANRFKDIFEDCVAKLVANEASESSGNESVKVTPDSTSVSAVSKTTSAAVSAPSSSTTAPVSLSGNISSSAVSSSTNLSELFKPKQGSWECEGCLCRNEADKVKCPACGKAKPGSKPTESSPFAASSTSGAGSLFNASTTGFSFGQPVSGSPSSIFGGPSVVASSTTKPVSAATPKASATPSSGAPSLSDMFKSKAGSWECEGCLCRNQEDQTKCPACGTMKPGAKADGAAKPTSAGFSFGSGSGFAFGAPATSQAESKSSGFSFGTPAGGSFFTPAASSTETSAPTGGFSFSTPLTTKATSTVATPAKGGFAFGNAAATTASSVTPSKAPAAGGFTMAKTSANCSKDETDSKPGGLLASLLTTDNSKAQSEEKSAGFSFSMTPSQKSTTNMAASSTQSSTGFQFSLQKTPAPSTSPAKPASSLVPGSPEVDDRGLYVTKEGEDAHIHFEPIVQLPDKVDAKTGEEEEEVLFESRARMYRFVTGEWKERGVGVLKILKHKKTNKGRILMRRDQVLKICCNHVIKPDLDLQPMPKMEGKAWLWFAMDFSEEEGKMEQLAVRFKKPETATEFKSVFDKCKDNFSSDPLATPQKTAVTGQSTSGNQSDDDVIFVKEEKSPGFPSKGQLSTTTADTTVGKKDDDVVFVKEEEATPEQKAMAAKYLLPANFYLYEKKKPCKGCLGCTDGEMLPPKAKTKAHLISQKKADSKPMSYADAAKSPTQSPASVAASSQVDSPKSQPAAGPAKSLFGPFGSGTQPAQDQTPTKSIFGTTPDSSSKSVFGASVFGSAATMDKPFSFASPQASGDKPTSIFGSKTTNSPDFSSLIKGSPVGTSSDAAAKPAMSAATSDFTFGSVSSGVDFSSLASSGQASFLKKDETSGPFKFQGAGQKLFGAGGASAAGGGGDEGDDVAPSNDPHFEPIIPLPELVEVKTGEEDWTVLFCHRAKTFRFDSSTNQWKEKGVGDIKLMSFNNGVMFRVLQRREQVLKLSVHHLITKEMTLKPMSSAMSAWCWVASDLSGEAPTVEQLAVKFKTKELAAKFKDVFEECQAKLKRAEENPVVKSEPSQSQPGTKQLQRTQENIPTVVAEEEAKAGGHDDDGEYDDDDEYDDDEEEEIIFEKRATLSSLQNGQWEKLGMGTIQVKYNEEVNGNGIVFFKDDGTRLCSHIICREHNITMDPKNKCCEWKPIDFATDEPIRQHFKAGFSSTHSAEQFTEVFMEGKGLAVDSNLSEKLPTDIEVLEFSHGEA